MTRLAMLTALGLLSVACGAGRQKVLAPTLPPASPQALGKMVQGVQSAKEPSGKDRAIQLTRDAVAADPGLWEAHYNLGVLLADKGDLKAAERELSQAAQVAPNAEDVAVALSEVRRRQGDGGGAIEALQVFVKQNPDAKVAPIALVTALREGGKVKEAIEQGQRVLVYHSSDPYALSELALSNMEQGEVDTAELLIAEALKADDKSAVAERTAGLISLKKGDDALAFKHFQRASELDPKDTTARLNTGTVLLQAGVYDKSAQEFRAVLAVEPESTDAMLGLAAARRGQSKKDDQSGYREAEKLLLAVLDQPPVTDGIGLIGMAARNAFSLEHEATHRTPFANRTVNDWVDRAGGLILLLPFEWFRYVPPAHHRHTNLPGLDPELGGPKPQTLRRWFWHVSGIPCWLSAAKLLASLAFGQTTAGYLPAAYLPTTAVPRIRREAQIMLALQALVAASLAFTPALLWFQAIPVLLGQPFLRLHLLAEHGDGPCVADMLENTRTTFTNRIAHFVAWNMPYHVEHHTCPSGPFHHLPALNSEIRAHLKVTANGYTSFTRACLARRQP